MTRPEELQRYLASRVLVHAGPCCLINVHHAGGQPVGLRLSFRDQLDLEFTDFEQACERLAEMEANGAIHVETQP